MKNLDRIAVVVLAIGACAFCVTACQTQHEHHSTSARHAPQYTCSMHPEVVQSSPGKCPLCAMDLEEKK